MLSRVPTRSFAAAALPFVTLIALSSCAPDGRDPAARAASAFATQCALCHGPAGAGDGPAARHTTPPPRDLRTAEWQASVTDAQIADTITMGGAATGKSLAMPAFGHFRGDPELLAALVAHVRRLGR